tara:strand:+ start:18794 stop:20047 length:1254 start_codon:yes stop_codon:yes gene_type:complete
LTSPHKKILVVVESIDVEDSSGSKANVALILNLHKIGYQLLVFHYTRKEVKMPGIECFAVKENRRSVLFFLSRLERHLRYLLKIKINKPLENIFGFSFTLFNDRDSILLALRKLKNFKPDLVLTLSKGGSFRPHHALLKIPKFHEKWVAYIHDPYPMHWYPEPYAWRESGFKQKEEFMVEIAQKCAYAAFPSKLLMEWMGKHNKNYLEKGIVIPHQIDRNEPNESVFPEYFNLEKFNILHAGNLLWGRDPEGLIKGFLRFLDVNPQAKLETCLLFLGGQNHYSKILSEYALKFPQIYVSSQKVPFNDVQVIQKACAVNVILEAKSKISPFLPGKFPHCVSADKPILLLAPEHSESKRLLGKDYLYWAEIDETNTISQHIENLYNHWKNEPIQLKFNRPDLEDYLSINYLKDAMNKLF